MSNCEIADYFFTRTGDGNQRPFLTGSAFLGGVLVTALQHLEPLRIQNRDHPVLSQIAQRLWLLTKWSIRSRMQKTSIRPLSWPISQFDISAVTHRNTSLEASKLEYINKHHLMRAASTATGIQVLAEKVHNRIRESFPRRWAWLSLFLHILFTHSSQNATIDRIKQAIVILEVQKSLFFLDLGMMIMFCKGRLTNIYDIPKHAPYLFQEPILSSQEAQTMLSQIRREDYGAVRNLLPFSMTNWRPFYFDRSSYKNCESQTGRYFGTVG